MFPRKNPRRVVKAAGLPNRGPLPLYGRIGIISAIIPELIPSKGLEQPSEHYWDVFTHSVKTIDAVDYIIGNGKWEYSSDAIQAVPWSSELEGYFNEKISSGSTRLILLKLTALLHDIAKPKMKFIDENGKIRFFGHPKEGASALKLWRATLQQQEIRIVEEVTRHHLRPTQMTQIVWLPTMPSTVIFVMSARWLSIPFLYTGRPSGGTRAYHDLLNWQHTAAVKYILEKHREQANKIALPRLISGRNIMKEFGQDLE